MSAGGANRAPWQQRGDMATETGRVEPADEALRRHRCELDELMREQGVSVLSELLDSFRGDDGTLDESEAFHRAAAALAADPRVGTVSEPWPRGPDEVS